MTERPASLRAAYKRLSEVEARSALYIDFEGRRDQPPVLLGILRRAGRGTKPFVHQEAVDPLFADLGCPVMALSRAVEVVVVRAEHGDRRIVSWSEHDLNIVASLRKDHAELVARFESRYINARAVAERWRDKLHRGDKPEIGRLGDYLALIEYQVPDEAGPGRVGETIRILRGTLKAGRHLTENQRRRWYELLEHNRHDCAGMRWVCLRATQEMDATG